MNTSGVATSSGLRALNDSAYATPTRLPTYRSSALYLSTSVAWSPLNTDSYTVMDAIFCAYTSLTSTAKSKPLQGGSIRQCPKNSRSISCGSVPSSASPPATSSHFGSRA